MLISPMVKGFITRQYLDNLLEKLCEKLWITVQLSHYPYKFGPDDVYTVVHIEPLSYVI